MKIIHKKIGDITRFKPGDILQRLKIIIYDEDGYIDDSYIYESDTAIEINTIENTFIRYYNYNCKTNTSNKDVYCYFTDDELIKWKKDWIKIN